MGWRNRRLSRTAAVEVATEQVFAELLRKAEAGELPTKKAEMLRHLKERVASGKILSGMQEDLLRDVWTDYGICEA